MLTTCGSDTLVVFMPCKSNLLGDQLAGKFNNIYVLANSMFPLEDPFMNCYISLKVFDCCFHFNV